MGDPRGGAGSLSPAHQRVARHVDMGMGTALREGPVDDRAATPKTACRMTGDAGSVRTARTVVRDLMAREPADVRDVAVLLTDELVTNALVHGGGRFCLDVEVRSDAVRVAVADRGAGEPRVLHPSGDREHGRGMAIVDALAASWGVDREHARKVVWFELPLGR